MATEHGLRLQVVSSDYREDRDTFTPVARVLRKRLPQLPVTWDRDSSIGKPCGADHGIPLMVMLHRDGTVAHIHVRCSEDMLDSLIAEINALFRESASPPAIAAAR